MESLLLGAHGLLPVTEPQLHVVQVPLELGVSASTCVLQLYELKWSFWDMQVESQLELAKGLSESLENRLFLKREDLQPVRPSYSALCLPRHSQISPAEYTMDSCCSESS